jgi:hypothetical protein
MNKITSSGNNHFKYIKSNSRLYALSMNNDYSVIFDILVKRYSGRVLAPGSLDRVMFEMDVWDGGEYSEEFIKLFFESNLWRKFIINTGTINSNSIESLYRFIDLVFCVDYNYGSTISKINYDKDGLNSTLNIFTKKSKLISYFGGGDYGDQISSIPISNIKDYVGSPDWIAIRMINNNIITHGKVDSRLNDQIYNDFIKNY